MDTLYIVVPCYNEEDVLSETSKRLKEKLLTLIKTKKISERSKILFVNDGSVDNTWEMISNFHAKDISFSGVNLSRNQGHQNALVAGLAVAANYADMIISMDADLQDDVDAVDKMIHCYHEGFEIVYGVRSSRRKDTFFKRFTAEAYYKVLKILGVDIVFNHADYRLMSRRAVEGLLKFDEVNLFIRGIVPQVGYRWTTVPYERAERFAGQSKYPLKKMLSFAMDGITSFSVKPLRLISQLGITVCFISIIMFAWCLFQHFAGKTITGWSSIMVSIWFLGGVQLISLGVIGEYIGKIYGEAKHRPRYIIESILNEERALVEENDKSKL